MCPAAQGQRVLRPANGEEPGPGPRVPPPGLPAPTTAPRISCFTALRLGFSWVVEGNVSRVGEDDKPWKPSNPSLFPGVYKTGTGSACLLRYNEV